MISDNAVVTGAPTVDTTSETKDTGVRTVPMTSETGPTSVCRIACVVTVEPVGMTVVLTTWTTVMTCGPGQVARGGWLVVLVLESVVTETGIAEPELVMYVLGSCEPLAGMLVTVWTMTAGACPDAVACGARESLPVTVLVVVRTRTTTLDGPTVV